MNIVVEDVKECLEGAFKNLAEAMDIAEQAYQQIRGSTVYVVMVAKGEYSDREVNCHLVFLDEEEAKKHVENLTLKRNQFISFKNEQLAILRDKMGIIGRNITDEQQSEIRMQVQTMLEEKILDGSFDLIRPHTYNVDSLDEVNFYDEVKFYIEEVKVR